MWLLCKNDYAHARFLLRNNKEIHRIKHFSSQENYLIFHIFYEIEFSRVLL